MSADNTDLIPLQRTTASKYGHSVQEISDLKCCIDQMREEIKDKQTALETLQVKNCDLTSQVEGLQQTLVGKDELLVSLKDHKQETHDHKQETRDHQQETRDHKQETRDHKQETHDHKQETRDHKQETRDMLEQKLVPKERDLAHSQVEGLQEKLLGKESELEYLQAELRRLKKQLRYKEQSLPNMEAGLAKQQQKCPPQLESVPGISESRKLTAINKEVILHHAENPYKPPHRQLKPDTEQTTVEKLNRKIRSILNKLTAQNFQTLMQQMLNLNIDTEEKLKGVVHIIFEKAIAEPFYSVAYANACKIMATQVTVTSSCDPQEKVTFNKLLLNRCQTEFEKDKSESLDLAKMQKEIDEADSKDKRKLLQEERDLAEAKAQSRSLGNIVLIGQLFKLNMLTERIMHECIINLLKSTDEDNLECLCRLMTIVGKFLDHDKAEPLIDQYFIDIEKIIKSRCTSVRTRFMLQDLQELRSCKWKPRRDDNAPKTIGQIHKVAAEEKAKKQALHGQQPPFTPHGGRSSRGGAGGSADDHGWQEVGPVRLNRTDPN